MANTQGKTEKPTSKRLNEARSRGNVPKSRELNMAIGCLGGSLAIYFFSGFIFTQFRQLYHELWGQGFKAAAETHFDHTLFLSVSSHFFTITAPIVLVVLILAIVSNFLQVRWVVAWKALEPNLSKLNPLKGFGQFFTLRSLVELAKSLLKMAVVSSVVYSVISGESHLFSLLVEAEAAEIAKTAGHLTLKILMHSGLIMLFFAILDFSYQKWQHIKDLMMSRQEVKEEHIQSEGNPQIKSRIRRVQRAIARQRMMSKVKKATVVITNPTHYAIALAYDRTMEAPRVLAKGKNLVAAKIISLARKHKIPIVQNPPLARALYDQVELEEYIPASLYRAVAKVLAYLYRQRNQRL